MYVLDTGVISNLHKNYYRKRFVSLWKEFDQLVADGKITSTREVFHELGDGSPGADLEWAKANAKLFATPDAKEGAFVAKIYAVAHFQANIERQKLYKGGRNADAFVVARAYAIGGTVVTAERLKPNAVKVPNICTSRSPAWISRVSWSAKVGSFDPACAAWKSYSGLSSASVPRRNRESVAEPDRRR